MLTFNFTPFPVLKTERLVLRKIEETDVAELFFLRSDSNVLTYLDKAPASSTEEVLGFINQVNESLTKNETIIWAITNEGDNTLIGTICFWNTIPKHYRAEIGYVLHPGMQGKGIMDEALKAVVHYGFSAMALHSIEANVNPANAGSIKLLVRNGFVREGYFKENYYYNGKFIDSAIYSLVSNSVNG